MKKVLAMTFLASMLAMAPARAEREELWRLWAKLKDASIIAQDDKETFLGKITDKYDKESVFNENGLYGDKYSTKSIWNKNSMFGDPYSIYSPFNSITSKPPKIVKDGEIIGYLTINKYIEDAITPDTLKAVLDQY